MTTINRSIRTTHDRAMAARLIENRAVPFTLSLTDGKHRSTAQNRLQHMWMNEIAQQKGDMTPAEVRAYCKLTIGVPILRNQNEAFRAKYDEVVKPLPYQHKLAVMTEPLDLPVTRIMTTKQTAEYLDGIIRHFGEQGIVLTIPEELRDQINDHKTPDPNAESSSPASDQPGENSPPVSSPGANSPDKNLLIRVFGALYAAAGPDREVVEAQSDMFADEFKTANKITQAKATTILKKIQMLGTGEIEEGECIEYLAGVIGVDPAQLMEGNA